MNIYANCPGTDRMINELGKIFAFCKYFFMAQTTILTVNFLSACLYIADTELANYPKKVTKSGKKDHVHPGQLSCIYWMNCTLDSRAIIGRHGLIPKPSNDINLKELFPPLSVIVDHFKAKDKTQTKQQCNDVVQRIFLFWEKTDFLELHLYAYLTNSHSTTNLGPS